LLFLIKFSTANIQILKNYKSLEEINQHLKILRLKADIHKKRAEIHTKFIKHALNPTNLLAEGIATLSQKYFYHKILHAALKKINLFPKK